jgi:hypothetical protein
MLRRERRALVRAREERIRDLGGLILEMFRRDRFREDLMREQAEEIFGMEARVQEIDTLLVASRQPPQPARCACGAPLVAGVHFCANCGRPAPTAEPVVACQKCGHPLPADARFCGTCGAPAPEAVDAQAEAPAPGATGTAAPEPRQDTPPPAPALESEPAGDASPAPEAPSPDPWEQ